MRNSVADRKDTGRRDAERRDCELIDLGKLDLDLGEREPVSSKKLVISERAQAIAGDPEQQAMQRMLNAIEVGDMDAVREIARRELERAS